MDIDDILADIDDSSHTPLDPGSSFQDLQLLTRVYVSERAAPELLAWPESLINRCMQRISKQIELVEDQTGQLDSGTNFKLVVLQTDLERYKFLIRAFLRARLSKIDRFPIHYSTAPNSALLSPSEMYYLKTHQALLSSHYDSAFMSQFPEKLRGMDDTSGGVSMVDEPDVDKAVFVRVLRDVEEEVRGPGIEGGMLLRRGDVVVVRWSLVKEYQERGDVELL